MAGEVREELRVLEHRREAIRYRILVEIAHRQPAVSQSEIAETLGVTPQSVSDYLNELVEAGHVRKLGRGRWEITADGVDWLQARTEELQAFTRYVAEDVIGSSGVEAAIATAPVEVDQRVTVSMVDGLLRATPGDEGPATARAVTDAVAGRDVGLTDFTGVLDFDVGSVSVLEVPPVDAGGSTAVDTRLVRDAAAEHALVAVAGVEAHALVAAANVEPDLRYGTPAAVQEAALKGESVVLIAVASRIAEHLDQLREYDISFERIVE